MVYAALLSLFSLVLSVLFYPVLFELLRSSGAVRDNFRGRSLPAVGGLLLPLVVLAVFVVSAVLPENPLAQSGVRAESYLVLIVALAFLGLLDDLLGSRAVGGFRGHFAELARGTLTTGSLKALGGGLVALYIVEPVSDGAAVLALNGLLLALWINTINLFDLRPGRAIKVFLASGVVVVVAAPAVPVWPVWTVILPIVLVLFYTDLREKCMMGDVGSNVLGGVIGLTAVMSFGNVSKIVFVLMLLLVQVFSERYSITDSIQKNSILRWLDQLGRSV